MDTPLIRDLAQWTNSFFKSIGLKPLPPSPPPPVAAKSLVSSSMLSSTTNNFIRCAGLSGASAICLGVYGAHMMKDNTSDDLRRLFELAQTYHLLHSVALLGLPLVSRPMVTGSLFLGGMVLFCGPMYFHAIRNDTRFRPITPYGGILLIAGWLSIIIL
ncbi:unnamed protein product [Rotaria sp. Silwood1]|nr:unnamed protein product [Rotaria sp. Silwood1]CAF1264675.1 unnamed protein product [Rotaria sp. Silwood1]CAF3519672.1 unnamed protein product [Rotaria sp. Silwood1]CAF4983874.1 unnamed protein product [Rotaria sp. Silwood1]